MGGEPQARACHGRGVPTSAPLDNPKQHGRLGADVVHSDTHNKPLAQVSRPTIVHKCLGLSLLAVSLSRLVRGPCAERDLCQARRVTTATWGTTGPVSDTKVCGPWPKRDADPIFGLLDPRLAVLICA
jgi:hypothetical protein